MMKTESIKITAKNTSSKYYKVESSYNVYFSKVYIKKIYYSFIYV